MNWKRVLTSLTISILIGVIAGGFVYTQFKRIAEAKSLPTTQAVVAASDLPLGRRLQATDLRLVTWPASKPLPGMFGNIEDCLGRALVTTVVENEPVLEGKLAPKEGGAGLSVTIPQGMRAVSVAVNDVIGVAGFVVPGTMVDVLVTGSAGNGATVTRTILENVRVLAAGPKIEQDRQGKPESAPVITLLVTPEEADKLTMASTQGKIQLALRNVLDSQKVEPPAVNQTALFAGIEAPVPQAPAKVQKSDGKKVVKPAPAVPAPPPNFDVEVIRGDKKEVSHFAGASANP
jgi:pilus assembly protein CpaB